MSEYVEIDLSTGQTVRDLVGYNFTVSPNGKEVAHVGWIPHFAPPYAKSEYLQIDHTTIYPLPKGMSPVEQEGLRSEEHTSELQSRLHLVCRLLLEKKKNAICVFSV